MKQVYGLPKLKHCISTTTSLTYGCPGGHMVFLLLINFLGFDWQPKQVTIGLVKT